MSVLRRDILLMRREVNSDPELIAREAVFLDQLLQKKEAADDYFISFELLDMNRFKIFRDKLHILKAIKQHNLKPFQFLVNRN